MVWFDDPNTPFDSPLVGFGTATFTPPIEYEVPPFAIETTGSARRLMSWASAGPRGRNVFYLSDGTVTETDPDSQTFFWDRQTGSPYVARAFWSAPAEPYELSAEEATALTEAGYVLNDG